MIDSSKRLTALALAVLVLSVPFVAMAQGHANYNRAFSTCMTARGYAVSM